MEQSPLDDWGQVGPDASSELVAATSIIALVGGLSGQELAGHDGLLAAGVEIHDGMIAQDETQIETGIEHLAAACDDSDLTSVDHDTSDAGMFSYACALADDVTGSSTELQEVIAAGEGSAGELMNKAMGAAALLGRLSAWQMPDHSDLSVAANGLYAGLSRPDVDLADENLGLIATQCQAT